MIILDYQDRRPIYEQVVEKLETLIFNGVLLPGEKLPSVRQMAMDLSINPNTIQRAYMELEQQGLIYPVKGKGNFVAENENIRRAGKKSFIRELQELLRKGRKIGLQEEDVQEMIRQCYKEGEV